VNPASHKWQPGEPADDDGLAPQYADEFVGDSIAFYIFQVPAPAGADLESWEGLHAAHRELCDETTMSGCPADYTPAPMCLGVQDCAPAIIALVGDNPFPVALIGDPEKGMVTVIQMGRPDRHEAAARYGGSVALLKSILNQLDVREPQAGETPH
jgi:hypothetical protein